MKKQAYLILFISICCILLQQPLFSQSQSDPINIFGLLHVVEGSSVLTPDVSDANTPKLAVSNLDTAGIRIKTTAAEGINLRFDEIDVPEGSFMEYILKGSVSKDGKEEVVEQSMMIKGRANEQKDVFVKPSEYAGAEKIKIEAFLQGAKVKEMEVAVTDLREEQSIIKYRQPYFDFHGKWDNGSCQIGISWELLENTNQVTLPNGEEIETDLVLISVVQADVPVLENVRIKGFNIPKFIIQKESIEFFGHSHKVINTNTCLLADNKTTKRLSLLPKLISIPFGTAIDLTSCCKEIPTCFDLELEPIKSTLPGSYLTLAARGKINGIPNQKAGSLQMKTTDLGQKELIADYTELKSPPVRVEIYNDGELVHEFKGDYADKKKVAEFAEFPTACGKLASNGGGEPSLPCFYVSFPLPTTFKTADDTTITGTEIRVLAEVTEELEDLSNFSIEAFQIPKIDLVKEFSQIRWVFLPKCAYQIESTELECGDVGETFCVWLNAIRPLSEGITGLNACFQYDPALMQPTANATLGAVVLNGNLLTQGPDAYITLTDLQPGYLTTTTAYTGTHSFLPTTGQVLCVEFELIAPLTPNVSTVIQSCQLRESLGANVETECVAMGRIYSNQEGGVARGRLIFHDDNSKPISTNNTPGGMTTITSVNDTCQEIKGSNVSMPDQDGNFTHDLNGGTHLNVVRDITPDDYATNGACEVDVWPIIDGEDCAAAAFISNYQTNGGAAVIFSGGIPTPYQMIACDVNMNDLVDADDISQMQRRINGLICEFEQQWNYDFSSVPYSPNVPYQPSFDWRIMDALTVSTMTDYQAHSNYPNFPLSTGDVGYWRDNVPDVPMCLAACGDGSCCGEEDSTYLYYAVLLGDLTANWNSGSPSLKNSANSDKTLIFNLTNMEALGNNRYRFGVAYNSDLPVYALDFRMNYDQSRMQINTVMTTAQGNSDGFKMVYNDYQKDELRLTSYNIIGSQTDESIYYIEVTMLSEGSVTEQDLGGIQGIIGTFTEAPTAVEITPAIVSSISEQSLFNNTVALQAYPNPTEEMVHVTLGNVLLNNDTQLSVYNIQGQLLQQLAVVQNTTTIDLQSLPSGIYIVKAEQQGATIGYTKVMKH